MISVVLVLTTRLFAVAVACVTPSPYEALLPRSLVFRDGSIDVVMSDRVLHDQRWSFILEAHETRNAFEVVLGRKPLIVLSVAKSRMAAHESSTLREWLRRNRPGSFHGV